MQRTCRRSVATLAVTLSLSLSTAMATISTAAALPLASGATVAAVTVAAGDGLSGTWQVSRVCLAICVSPRPVLKVVRHWQGAVFMTTNHPPQVLYRMGMQVLVHGPKDSLLLTIRSLGRLMSGSGVGADGSTFKTTWRCVAAAGAVTVTTRMAPSSLSAVQSSSVSAVRLRQAPLAIEVC